MQQVNLTQTPARQRKTKLKIFGISSPRIMMTMTRTIKVLRVVFKKGIILIKITFFVIIKFILLFDSDDEDEEDGDEEDDTEDDLDEDENEDDEEDEDEDDEEGENDDEADMEDDFSMKVYDEVSFLMIIKSHFLYPQNFCNVRHFCVKFHQASYSWEHSF